MPPKSKQVQGTLSLFFTKVLVNALVWFFCLFSWEAADKLGGGMGRLLLFFGVRKKVVDKNLAFVFSSEATLPDRRKTTRQIKEIRQVCYETLGRAIVNYLRYKLISPEFFKQHCTYESLEILDDALKKGKGVVVLGAHIGGWEMVMTCITALGYPVSLIAKNLPNPYLNDLIIDYRLKKGLKSIQPKNSRDEILKTLAANETVALVFDQSMTHRQGIFVDFFGRPASTVKSTAGIVRDSGAQVIGGVMRRTGPAQYKMMFYPEIPWIKDEDQEKEQLLNTQEFSRFVERAILEEPGQWFWLHNRWKRRPKKDASA